MRKVTILLAVAIVAAQSVGCGCCNRMRDWLCRGAYCGSAPTYAAVPAPCAQPMQMAPMQMAPMTMAAPMAATCCPTCPTCAPMETSFEPGCSYGAGMPMFSDGGGWAPSNGGMMMVPSGGDPSPAP